MKFVYWSAVWLLGLLAVLWAMVAGQWLGAIVLVPAWLAAAVYTARRLGVTD